MNAAMQAQVQRVITYVAQLQNQVASQNLLITSLQQQLTAAQAADQPTTDSAAVAALLTAANVP